MDIDPLIVIVAALYLALKLGIVIGLAYLLRYLVFNKPISKIFAATISLLTMLFTMIVWPLLELVLSGAYDRRSMGGLGVLLSFVIPYYILIKKPKDVAP